MTTYGFTAAGFVPKPQAQIIAEVNAALQAALGAQVNLLPSTTIDALRGVMAQRESDLWAALQSLSNIYDPDTASDVFLDNILALNGTTRLAPVKSTVSEVLIGTNASVVPASTQLATTGTAIPFTTNANATIATLTAWAQNTSTAPGTLVTNGGNVYSAVQAATGTTSNAGGGPAGTGTAIVDGTVTWRYCGAGTAAVAAPCTASNYGANVAPAGTLVTITNPVAGLSLAVNPLDAVVGRAAETDAAARVRRQSILHAAGNAAFDAIRSALLAVPGVTAVNLLSNDSDATDGNGLLPHSIEPIISGSTATTAAILAAIHASKAAGIQTSTSGTSNGATLDSQGGSHTYYFTRPAALNVYIAITATVDSTVFDAVGGPGRIKANLAAFALGTLLGSNGKPLSSGYKAGDTVIDSALYPAIFLEPGLKDVSALFIGTAPAPVSAANIAVGLRQIAAFDTSRILFNGA